MPPQDIELLEPKDWFERGHDIVGGYRDRAGHWYEKYQQGSFFAGSSFSSRRRMFRRIKESQNEKEKLYSHHHHSTIVYPCLVETT